MFLLVKVLVLAVGSTHIMCLNDNSRAQQVTLTQEVKDAIVNRHNEIRASVRPTATNMQKMVWDERLAAAAAKWAMQCEFSHDLNHEEPELPAPIGQNYAVGPPFRTFVDAVNAWYNEVEDWTFGQWTIGTGHYIQEIFHSASLVGCGQARCSSRRWYISTPIPFYVCNYFTAPNNGDPYERGSSCGQCPDKCDASGKLCDCGSKVCAEGERLNLSTCQCQ